MEVIRRDFTDEERQMFREQLEKWKEKYGPIYVTEIRDQVFIWRLLTRKEHKLALELYEDDLERNEFVCRRCVLEPEIEDYSSDIYAGIPDLLAHEILTQSGFMDANHLKQMMREYDQEMEIFENQIPCVIKEAFPDIPMEEIESWPWPKTLWYFSRAKFVLSHLRQIPIQFQEQGAEAPPVVPPDIPTRRRRS